MFDSLAYAIALLTITDVSRFLKGDRKSGTIEQCRLTKLLSKVVSKYKITSKRRLVYTHCEVTEKFIIFSKY